MGNFAFGAKADGSASGSIGCRDFNTFTDQTKRLVLATRGDKPHKIPGGADCFVAKLGDSLSVSPVIKDAAQQISESKPLIGTSRDYLSIISHEVLAKYHYGTQVHMTQVYQLLGKLREVILDLGPKGLSNIGTEERRQIEHLLYKMPKQRWENVELAAIIHDACKAAFDPRYWLETGEFNPNQRSMLPFHTSLFIPLAEMFAVNPEVAALVVMHHYIVKDYPGEDVISRLNLIDQLWIDDFFCIMVEAINFADCLAALLAKRPEYRPQGSESFSYDKAMEIIKKDVRSKNIGRWFIKCIEVLHKCGTLDKIFPKNEPELVFAPV